jgi:hypothetical protein|tara:strand:- start:7347 stop:7982 length:636 start_codon:yes stop_codon:yes gene_type:complete
MDDNMPSIMRTVTPSQSATPASISEKAKSVAQTVRSSVTPMKSDGGVDIIKIILIVAIVGFLAYNLYLYFTEGTDVLGKYFGIGITGAAKGTEVAVDTVAEGTKDTVSVAQNVTNKGLDAVAEGGEQITKRAESPIERQLDEEEKKEEEAENVDANSSFASNLKKTVKGGYCYIGTDRTFRSCVKVDPGDVCMSNKVFPTKDICINPNLRR